MAAQSQIVIVGANGRLGQALQRACAKVVPECGVLALTRAEADLGVAGSVAAALDGRNFDLLLMAAAMTDVDACEREPNLARRLNAEAPGECAQLCAERGARMIHFSTDYVFDGKHERPYTESDAPNPQSVYGSSKLAGEGAVLAASADHLVVRLAWLYGAGSENATPDWTVARAVAGASLKIVSDKYGSPSYALDIAEAVTGLFFNRAASGVMHLSNTGACSWIEWARECVVAACEEGMIESVPEIDSWGLDECFAGKAPRPHYSVMANDRYRELSGKELRPWQEALRDYVREVVKPRLAAGK